MRRRGRLAPSSLRPRSALAPSAGSVWRLVGPAGRNPENRDVAGGGPSGTSGTAPSVQIRSWSGGARGGKVGCSAAATSSHSKQGALRFRLTTPAPHFEQLRAYAPLAFRFSSPALHPMHPSCTGSQPRISPFASFSALNSTWRLRHARTGIPEGKSATNRGHRMKRDNASAITGIGSAPPPHHP